MSSSSTSMQIDSTQQASLPEPAVKEKVQTKKGKPGPYVKALQAWNTKRGGWNIPKRGTKEYAEVMALMIKMQAVAKTG